MIEALLSKMVDDASSLSKDEALSIKQYVDMLHGMMVGVNDEKIQLSDFAGVMSRLSPETMRKVGHTQAIGHVMNQIACELFANMKGDVNDVRLFRAQLIHRNKTGKLNLHE